MTNLHRRSLIKALGASALLSALPTGVLAAKSLRPLYIDGLSFLPDSLDDLAASGLSAYLCDISAIEEVKQEDGTLNYKRTYNACIKSIADAGKRVSDNPGQLLQGLSAKDIKNARESGRTAVFFQIQGGRLRRRTPVTGG